MRDVLAILYGKLKENPALPTILTHVPQGTTYPYITLEKLKSEEGCGVVRSEVKLKVWSRYPGNAEISRYEMALKDGLEVPGWIPGTCVKIESVEVKLLNDGITRVLQMMLMILMREI